MFKGKKNAPRWQCDLTMLCSARKPLRNKRTSNEENEPRRRLMLTDMANNSQQGEMPNLNGPNPEDTGHKRICMPELRYFKLWAAATYVYALARMAHGIVRYGPVPYKQLDIVPYICREITRSGTVPARYHFAIFFTHKTYWYWFRYDTRASNRQSLLNIRISTQARKVRHGMVQSSTVRYRVISKWY